MDRRSLSITLVLIGWLPLPGFSQTQIQLSCSGAVVEARGNAELKRATRQLRLSLSLEAEAATDDGSLAELQRRRQLAIGEEPHEATAAPSRHRL